jgi:hypothetical protein
MILERSEHLEAKRMPVKCDKGVELIGCSRDAEMS